MNLQLEFLETAFFTEQHALKVQMHHGMFSPHQQKSTLTIGSQKSVFTNKPLVNIRTQPLEPHAASSQQNKVALLMQIANGMK